MTDFIPLTRQARFGRSGLLPITFLLAPFLAFIETIAQARQPSDPLGAPDAVVSEPEPRLSDASCRQRLFSGKSRLKQLRPLAHSCPMGGAANG